MQAKIQVVGASGFLFPKQAFRLALQIYKNGMLPFLSLLYDKLFVKLSLKFWGRPGVPAPTKNRRFLGLLNRCSSPQPRRATPFFQDRSSFWQAAAALASPLQSAPPERGDRESLLAQRNYWD